MGIPGVIAAALQEHARRRADLARQGVSEAEADEQILLEARAAGGTPAPGETINLSAWSERAGIARGVLEALVLSIHRAYPEPREAPPVLVVPVSEDWMPLTPPPPATRHPRSGVRTESVRSRSPSSSPTSS